MIQGIESPLANRQLAAWQDYASRIPIFIEMRTTEAGHSRGPGLIEWHLTCQLAGCGRSIQPVYDGEHPYLLTWQDTLARMVDHLRHHHEDIEEAIYRAAGIY